MFAWAAQSRQEFFQPMSAPEFSDLAIKISYQGSTKVAKNLPMYIEDLFITVQNTFKEFFINIPDFNDFEMYFIDSDGEKWMIETNEDLQAAYMHAKYFDKWLLKAFVEYKHGYSDKQKCMRWAEWFRNDGDVERKRQFKERSKLREYSFMKGNCIVRDGYVYEKYKRVDEGKVIYRCEDYLKIGCKGRWIAKVTAYGGEFGEIDSEHTFPPEMHSCNLNEELQHANPQNNGKKNNVQMSKQEVKKLIAALVLKNPSMTKNEVIAEIKSWVSHADLPPKVEIEYILHKIRRAISPGVAGYGLINIEGLKTLRHTQFGREMSLSVIDNLPRLFLYIYSDWQESVANEISKHGEMHLLIDRMNRWCPRMFKQLVNISIFDKKKKVYIPVGHLLMQTRKKEGYLIALKWFKDKLKLNPKYVTWDFDSSLIQAIHETFDTKTFEVDVKPSFFHFSKSIWCEAMQKGLNKPELINNTKKLILEIQSLWFTQEDQILSKFVALQETYSKKSKFYEEFISTFADNWIDGSYSDFDYFFTIHFYKVYCVKYKIGANIKCKILAIDCISQNTGVFEDMRQILITQ